jgi:glucose-6-phosphate isomerase
VAADGTGIRLDLARQAVNSAVMNQLLALAQQAGVAQQRDAMFAGAHINTTEDRAVLHVALRGAPDTVGPWGAAVHADVQAELTRVCAFAGALRSGERLLGEGLLGGESARHRGQQGEGGEKAAA